MAHANATARAGESSRDASQQQPQQPPYRLLNDAQMEHYAMHLREVGETAVWMVSSAKYGNGVHQLRDESIGTFWQSDGVLPHAVRVEFPRLTAVHSVAVLLSYQSDESYTPARLSIRTGTHEHDIAEVVVVEVNQPNGWVVSALVDDDVVVPAADDFDNVVSPAQPPNGSGPQQTTTTTRHHAAGGAAQQQQHHLHLHGHHHHHHHHQHGSATSVAALQQQQQVQLRSPVYCTILTVIITENHQQGRDTHVRGVRVYAPPLPPVEKSYGSAQVALR